MLNGYVDKACNACKTAVLEMLKKQPLGKAAVLIKQRKMLSKADRAGVCMRLRRNFYSAPSEISAISAQDLMQALTRAISSDADMQSLSESQRSKEPMKASAKKLI